MANSPVCQDCGDPRFHFSNFLRVLLFNSVNHLSCFNIEVMTHIPSVHIFTIFHILNHFPDF